MQPPAPEPAVASWENRALLASVEIGKVLTAMLDLRSILKRIVEKLTELIPAQNWSLLLREEESGELVFEVAAGFKVGALQGLRIAPGEGISGQTALAGQTRIISDVRRDPGFSDRIDRLTGFTTRSLVCIPLRCRGKVLGVIEIVNLDDMERFRQRDLQILEILADYAAIAIENARLFQRVEMLSISDEYTGLYNARYLHRMLDSLLADPETASSGLAVAFMDIDHFKRVVDHYGHLLGSRVLREVGQTILGVLGPRDVAVKYGGDEFVLVMPGRGKGEALELVRRVLAALQVRPFLAGEAQPVRITASFGVATFPEDARSKKDLLLLADQAMYHVKRSGKNAAAAHAM
jgi:diguanylate cyclase (GGDEF)-like protein